MYNRRSFLSTSILASAVLCTRGLAQSEAIQIPQSQIKLSLKIGMVGFGKTVDEKFKGIKELGYDGIELSSPKRQQHQRKHCCILSTRPPNSRSSQLKPLVHTPLRPL